MCSIARVQKVALFNQFGFGWLYTSFISSMSMSPDASPDDACQLQTRHWVITNEDGHEERISGPGVVGQ